MELKIFLRLLQKRWWIVLFILVVTIVSSLAFTYSQTPIYSSSVTYVVSPSAEVLDGTGYLSGLSVLGGQPTVVSTYASIAASSSIKQKAGDSLGLGTSHTKNLSVSSRVQSGTNIIEITVEGKDPLLVQSFANRIGESTIEYIRTLDGVYDLMLIDGAVSPQEPIKPNKRLNLALGAAIGLVLGLGLAFLSGLNDY